MIVDESTAFGSRVAQHLRDEIVVWMTTVSPVFSFQCLANEALYS